MCRSRAGSYIHRPYAGSAADLRRRSAAHGWYHTIELGEGIGSRGHYDHRGVDRFGLAPSLEGRTALDVGTGDGFLAFENSYWPFTTRALQDMLLYADFTTAEVQGSFELPPHRLPVTAVIGRV